RQHLSRRNFLSILGGSAAAAVAALAPGRAPVKRVRLAKGFRDAYDLTHTFSPKLPVFPAFKPVQIRERFRIARDGFFANAITFDEHTGTHLDAPVHFNANRGSADRIPEIGRASCRERVEMWVVEV